MTRRNHHVTYVVLPPGLAHLFSTRTDAVPGALPSVSPGASSAAPGRAGTIITWELPGRALPPRGDSCPALVLQPAALRRGRLQVPASVLVLRRCRGREAQKEEQRQPYSIKVNSD